MSGIVYAVAMAGRGERFSRAGVTVPKYMVEARGRTLFEHSLASLPLGPGDKAVFIALREHEEKYGLRAFIGARCRAPWELVLLPAPTRGQAETVLAARDLVPAGSGLAIYNIDTAFLSPGLGDKLADPAARLDGVIGAFKLGVKDPKWSFARTGPGGVVTETAEKVQISDNALTGFYHFSRAEDFFETAAAAVGSGETSAGEFYVAPLYNKLIAAGRRFVLDVAERLTPLGTPEDVDAFRRAP